MATTINSRILRTFSLLVIICLLSVPTQAKYSGGTGELNDPYQIATAADLILLGDSPADYDKHFILTDNIDLNPNLPGRKVFNKAVIAQVTLVQDPSSLSTVGAPFVGVFDGNNHTVSHLTISGGDCVGLFGCLESGAEVRNLGVVNVNITTYGDYVGPLVGCNFGKVTQCHSTGSVSGMNFVGGLVGLNYSGRLTACYSTSTVSGDNRVGGLAGNNGTQYRYDRPAGSVTQCYSTGRVSGTAWGWGTGGLVGASDGAVAQCYSTATVSGGNVVGGLVGCNYTSVTQCYSVGAVSGSDNVGGLVGILGTAVACFWDTQTSGRATSVGGTGKTTAEMQRAATFATWDFQGTWKIQEGIGYPGLKWESNPNPAATTLEKVSGDNQRAIIGYRLAIPLTVCVKEQYGQGMAGVQVAFIVIEGDGTIEPASAVTNAGGLASAVVTLGPTAGLTQVRASVGSLSVDFSIEATPLPKATTLEKVSGDNQQAMVGSRLPSPLTVRVKDQSRQVMAGVQVTFAFVAGDGMVEPAVGVTNASGIASTTVTLGPTAGPAKVRASVGSLSVDFSIEATPLPKATTLEKVSGDNQQAMVGSRLPSPLTVRVKDQSRQVMAGVQVAFAFVAGNGTVEPASAVTNAGGLAAVVVTLGTTAGLTQVRATVGGLSVDFSIEATPLRVATTLEKVSGDNQRAVAGSKLAAPLAVRVKDQYGQNIAGVQVVFVVTVGDGTIEPVSVVTGANGLASAELTLGPTAGLTQVRVSVGSLSVDFSIEATLFAPATFSQLLYEPIAEIVVPTGDDLVTRAVEEKDGYVYLLTRDGILYTYDVANLPLQQSFVTYHTPVSTQTVSNGTGILRHGDYVYVYGDRGMTVLNVQNPRTPAVVGTSASNRRVYNLARHDDYLIAVGRVNGDVHYMDGKAMVYSISDPANPVLVSELSLGTGESGWSAAVYGSTLYIVHFSASTSHSVLQVVDFSDPSHLSTIRTLDLQTGSAYHLRIVGSQLVECGSDHISLWDLTRPSSPVLLTEQPAEPRVCAQDGDNIVTNGMVFRPSGSELQMVAAFTPGGSQVDGFPYGSAVNTSFVFIAQSGRILVLNASVPVLTINYARGGPGSFFTITGHDFPPNSTSTVVANDYTLGTVSTDSSGCIRFLLDTEQADEGRYIVTATSGLSASTSFVIASGEPVHPQEGSGTIFGIPSGITYVKYCGGSGTVDDPYRIAMAEDLMLLGESPEDYDKHFILTADIDLHPNLPGRKVFDEAVIAPHAGTAHTGGWPFNENPFKGIFDGNGHKISHLTINSGEYLGLFGQLADGAEVRNLGVVNVDIDNSSGERIGGLVGLSWNGTVINCYSTGTVTGNYYVGGLVGYNVGTVTCCYSTCVVDGLRWSIGGLVGYNGAYVQQSYSTGNVIGNIETGGLVGENGGTVTECYSTGRLWGSSDVGGLVGYDYDWSQADRCFWDTQTSGRAISAGGTGKTTAQMKRASTFLDAGWDFVDETANGTDDIWWILEGQDYPRLWWEAE